MTKGQEIANEWFNIGVPVGTDTKQQLAMTIDAAIAEAVSKRTVECANAAAGEYTVSNMEIGHVGCPDVRQRIHRAILALNTPAPAYPFGKDASGRQCADWRPVSGTILTSWCRGGRDTPIEYLRTTAAFCEVCGAPRTKGQ